MYDLMGVERLFWSILPPRQPFEWYEHDGQAWVQHAQVPLTYYRSSQSLQGLRFYFRETDGVKEWPFFIRLASSPKVAPVADKTDAGWYRGIWVHQGAQVSARHPLGYKESLFVVDA